MDTSKWDLMERAARVLGDEQRRDAVGALRRRLEREPGDVDLRWALADALVHEGQVTDAMAHYQGVVGGLLAAGQSLKSMAVCKWMESLEPGHVETHRVLADVFAARRDESVTTVDVPAVFTSGSRATDADTQASVPIRVDHLPVLPFFSGLTRHPFGVVLQKMKLRIVPPGEALVEEGTPAASMFVIVQGPVRVMVGRSDGRRTQSVLEEGAFFGESSIVVPAPRSASLVGERTVWALELSKDLADELCRIDASVKQVLQDFQKGQLLAARIRPPEQTAERAPQVAQPSRLELGVEPSQTAAPVQIPMSLSAASTPVGSRTGNPLERQAMMLRLGMLGAVVAAVMYVLLGGDGESHSEKATSIDGKYHSTVVSTSPAPAEGTPFSAAPSSGFSSGAPVGVSVSGGGAVRVHDGASALPGASVPAAVGAQAVAQALAGGTPLPVAVPVSGGVPEQRVDSLLGQGAAARAQAPKPVTEELAPGISMSDTGEIRATPQALRRIKEYSARHPDDEGARAAYALGVARDDPARALNVLGRAPSEGGALHALAEARALDAMGRSNEAMDRLSTVSSGTPAGGGASATVEDRAQATTVVDLELLRLRGQSGRCEDNLVLARRLGATGGVPGGLAWIRYQAACLNDVPGAEATGRALLELPRMTPVNRARVAGELAMVRLHRNDVAGALEACRQMDAFDPARTETADVAERCALVEGKSGAAGSAADKAAPETDADELRVGAALLRQRKPLPSSLGAQSWRRGGALLRAVVALRRQDPQRAVDEARGALLAPRRESANDVSPTLPELVAVAALAPPESAGLAVALARALAGASDGLDGAGPWEPVLVAAGSMARALTDGRAPAEPTSEAKKKWDGLPESKLRAFLQSSNWERRAFLDDPQLGPVAAVVVVRSGGAPGPALEKWRARAPRHPWILTMSTGS